MNLNLKKLQSKELQLLVCILCVRLQHFISDNNSLSCGVCIYSHSDLLSYVFMGAWVHLFSKIFDIENFSGNKPRNLSYMYLRLDSTSCPFPQLMTFYPGYFSLSDPLSFVPIRLLKFYIFRSPAKNRRRDRKSSWIKCHGYNLVPEQNSDLCLLSVYFPSIYDSLHLFYLSKC